MNKAIKISIPSPCHEKWQDMTPAEKGRFCASCQTKVVDFTYMSDRETAAVVNNDEYICGRFNNFQLDREIYVPKEKQPLWLTTSAAVISFLTLGNSEIIAQTPVPIVQQPQQNEHSIEEEATQKTLLTISGTVSDSANVPLPAVNVIIKGTTRGTETDLNGNFSIEAEKEDLLEFSFLGYKTKTITVNQSNINVILEDEEYIEVVIGLYIIKSPTFFGRIFRKIGNLFRKNE